jgi:bla regulator protein BlaR1
MNLAELERLAANVLPALWRASWQAGVIAVLVLAVQLLLRNQLSARWKHNLWLLVLLRLAIPVTPAAPFSVFNLTKHLPDAPAVIPVAPRVDGAPVIETPHKVAPAKPQATWKAACGFAWLVGVGALLARIAWASARLSRAVRRMQRVEDPQVLALLRQCADEVGIKRVPIVLSSDDLPAPALMGCIRPRLLLPEHVLSNFEPAELRLIALHELAHLKRHDVAINWLIAILQALHWFNPIVWLAFARLRVDRELAADELVLSATAGPDRNEYGNTIVKLLQSMSRRPSLAGTVGILERSHPLRRRITMIAQFHRRAKGWTALAAVCMIGIAGLALTDAVRGDDAPANSAPAANAPTTKPSPDASMVQAAADRANALKSPSDAKDVEQARAELATVIRNRRLIYSAEGKPINSDAVEAEIADATKAFDAALLQRAAQSTAVPVATTTDPNEAEQTYAKFQRRLPELNVDGVTFSDVIDFLRDVTGANIAVNWKALEAAGIDGKSSIAVRLRDVSLEQALRQLLKQAGGGSVALAFSTDGGVIVISTDEDVAPRVRAYDVVDLATSATTQPALEGVPQDGVLVVKNTIMENVATDSWRENGGNLANISVLGTKLIISTTDMHHLEIDRLLAEVRRAK